MDMKESLRSLLKEIILPEFQGLKTQQVKLEERLNSIDKRLADINAHIVDQSRRIDEINKRIDDTNKRIDSVRDELFAVLSETNKRLDRLYEISLPSAYLGDKVVNRQEKGDDNYGKHGSRNHQYYGLDRLSNGGYN